MLKRTEGSLAAKLGSNAKFLPSANQAPIIVRCTEMCSDVPKTQAAKAISWDNLRIFSSGQCRFFKSWVVALGFSGSGHPEVTCTACTVLPLHIPKGSSQLVPRGGQTIEVFAACQLDLDSIVRVSAY